MQLFLFAFAITLRFDEVGIVKNDPAYMDAWGGLLRIHADVVAQVEKRLAAEQQISLTWYDVLLSLEKAPHKRLRMSELADEIVLSRSALTRSVDKLEAEGHLRRERCAEDERGAYATLTKKGENAIVRARPIYWSVVKEFFGDAANSAELAALNSVFDKVRAHIKAHKTER